MDRLEEIRSYTKQWREDTHWKADIDWLITEVDRLRAELATLEENVGNFNVLYQLANHECLELRVDVERLQHSEKAAWAHETICRDRLLDAEEALRRVDEDYYGPAREYRGDAELGGEP
jgi:hypothetical protein